MKDPVCGMTVTTESAHTLSHEGKPYYFCSARCATRFAADPLAYVGKQAVSAVPPTPPTVAAAAAIYTCPMHPEYGRTTPATARSAA